LVSEAAEACNFIFCFAFGAKHDSVVASEATMRPKQQAVTGSGDLFRLMVGASGIIYIAFRQGADDAVIGTEDDDRADASLGH
jgi:hypothetical protein